MAGRPLGLALAWASLIACGNSTSGSKDDDGGDKNEPPPFICPAEDADICRLKSPLETPRAEGAAVRLAAVVVTTAPRVIDRDEDDTPTRFGLYVQDLRADPVFGGLRVTYGAADIDAAPTVGDVVEIEGTVLRFPAEQTVQELQLRATFVSVVGRHALTPALVSVDTLSSAEGATRYEGSYVEIRDVLARNTDVPASSGEGRIFGFEVDGPIIVSTQWTPYRARVDEPFARIAGIYRLGTRAFDLGRYLLTPRTEADIESSDPTPVITQIKQAQDPSHPGAVPMCRNPDGSGTQGVCARAELEDVTVTATGAYVSSRLRAMFVQDPRVTDGRFAGLKVVYFSDEENVPASGDRIDLVGQLVEYRRSLQLQYPSWKHRSSGDALAPVLVPPSAIARTEAPELSPYEAVLVAIEDVEVVAACLEDDLERDWGEWLVTGDVRIGNSYPYSYNGRPRPSSIECVENGQPTGRCACSERIRPRDQRTEGERFRRIAGVVDFSFGELKLQPRSDSDLALANPVPVYRTIRQIQDPADPVHVETCRTTPDGIEGRCLKAELDNVIVTAAGGYVSRYLRRAFVQDLSGDSALGVRVVYNPEAIEAPKAGDRVRVSGEVILWDGVAQIERPTFEVLEAETPLPEPQVVLPEAIASDLPAQAHPHLGQLIVLEDVAVSSACIASATGQDLGGFEVANVVEVSTSWRTDYSGRPPEDPGACFDANDALTALCMCGGGSRPDDARRLGDRFERLIGVVDFAFGRLVLQPRGDQDLVLAPRD